MKKNIFDFRKGRKKSQGNKDVDLAVPFNTIAGQVLDQGWGRGIAKTSGKWGKDAILKTFQLCSHKGVKTALFTKAHLYQENSDRVLSFQGQWKF